MAKTAYIYFLVEPTETKVVDDGTKQPSFSIGLDDKNTVVLDYLEKENKQPFALRFAVMGLPTEVIPELALDQIHRAKEHFLSVLRINYDPDVQFFPHTMTIFVEDGERPTLATLMEWRGFPDANKVRDGFTKSQKWSTEVRLLADSLSTSVPMQFQFLSLYKLLELHLKKNGDWAKSSLDELFSRFENAFQAAGFRKKPANELHDLRDRCAHIKSNNEVVGVTQLSRADLLLLEKALPIVRMACIDLLNEVQTDFRLDAGKA